MGGLTEGRRSLSIYQSYSSRGYKYPPVVSKTYYLPGLTGCKSGKFPLKEDITMERGRSISVDTSVSEV
jgi:hypothetical protein